MSDKLEVWQLCQHGKVKPHSVYATPDVCGGGKRIVLRPSPAYLDLYTVEVPDE